MTGPSSSFSYHDDDGEEDDYPLPDHATLAGAMYSVLPSLLPANCGDRLQLTAADGGSTRMVIYADVRPSDGAGARSRHAKVVVIQVLGGTTTERMVAFLIAVAARYAAHAYMDAIMVQSVLPGTELALLAACEQLGYTRSGPDGDDDGAGADLWLPLLAPLA